MKTLYVLIDADQVRYIGKTDTKNLNKKLDEHLQEAQSNPEKFSWIRKMFQEGRKPKLIPIFTYAKKDEEYYERMFISNYKFLLRLKLNQLLHKPIIAN